MTVYAYRVAYKIRINENILHTIQHSIVRKNTDPENYAVR